MNQDQVAQAIAAALQGQKSWTEATTGGTVTHSVSIQGKLDVKNYNHTEWTVAAVQADSATGTAAKVTLTNNTAGDFKPNLEFTFSGLAGTKDPSISTPQMTKGTLLLMLLVFKAQQHLMILQVVQKQLLQQHQHQQKLQFMESQV